MISHNTSGTTRVWAISLFLLLIVPTLAQAEDQVGIYFDEAYQNFSIEAPAPNTIITGYLVLNDPADNAGVAGWELCADIEGPGQFLSWELEGQTINIETAPCFQVGIGDYPLPLGPRVLLATFTLLVMEPLPISISVNPIYNASIPGEMAYLTDSDPSEIRVLHSASGNPSVAWINQQMPGAVIEPSQLNFDYVPLFNDATQTVSVYNPGGGPLFLDIELDGDAAFTLTTVSGPQTVNGGETLEIPVLFHPTEVGYFTTSLVFNHSLADNVFINGYGREPIAAWDMPPELIFGEIPIGSAVVLPFSISNTGETLLPVEPSLLSECLEFSVLNPGPYSLNPGESITLQVEFAPQSAGLIHCNLSLGSVVGSIPLFGTGHLVSLDYSLSPEFLDFPTWLWEVP